MTKNTSPKTYAIETINRADGSVDGHAAGCRDIARIAKREHVDRSGAWEATSKRAVFLDYNQDFIDEADGDETAGYVINWLPCADHVPATDDTTAAPAADTRTCTGTCGQTLPMVKFPTTKNGRRGTECRKCRDSRLAAR